MQVATSTRCATKSRLKSLSLSLSLTLSLCIVRGFGSREEPGGSIGRSAGRLRAGARWQHLSARAPSPGPRAPNWATLRARAHTHTHARTPLRHASLNNGINRPWRVINCRCQPDMTVYSAVRRQKRSPNISAVPPETGFSIKPARSSQIRRILERWRWEGGRSSILEYAYSSAARYQRMRASASSFRLPDNRLSNFSTVDRKRTFRSRDFTVAEMATLRVFLLLR